MSRKFVFATALAVCVAIALAPAFAAGRTDDRGTRSKQASARGNDAAVPALGYSSEVHQSSFGKRDRPQTADKVKETLGDAMKQSGAEMLATLNRAMGMDIPEGAEGDKIRFELYSQLGEAYAGTPAKQVAMFGQALQYASDPADRARLETRIGDLGGDVFAIAFQNDRATLDSVRTAGQNDTCDDPIFATLPASIPLSIDFGDADWVAYDHAGPDGAFYRIETVSPNPPFVDDTDLTLYGGCVAGEGNPLLAFNDDGGEGWMSRIDTDCLAPGTYYVEVGGWFDVTPVPDFTLEIEQTGDCILPAPDDYEPDDLREDATEIGLPTSIPAHANGWGRAKSEIQAHSIFPAGDFDGMMTKLSKDEWVSYSTQSFFPTKFNGFADSSGDVDNPDTYVEVYYEHEPNYGGLCNDPALGFFPHCYVDSDCPPPVGEPIPGLPTCAPLYNFSWSGSGLPIALPENPLAFNDDGGPGFSSRLEFCTPKPGSTWIDRFSLNEDYLVRVWPFSASDVFNYEVQVKNEHGCLYENENNGFFETADDLPLGGVIHGVYEASLDVGAMLFNQGVFPNGAADYDLFKFDVESDTNIKLWTDGYEPLETDTYLAVFVGPDDSGTYYDTGLFDDDGGYANWLSEIEEVFPPADELLGNTVADANYFVLCTSIWYNLNYPYELHADLVEIAVTETEPNNTVAEANDAAMGGRAEGSIDPTCDMDVWKLTLDSAAYVTATVSGGDSVMELVACDDPGIRIGCDDDSAGNFASRIDGCLPAGEWCYKLRHYSTGTFDYQVAFTGGESCAPTDPPSVNADGLFRCDESPPGEFDTCPN